MEPREYISRLNEILVKKQGLLEEIFDFTRQQKEALSEDNMNEMEILLAKKQVRMDAVDKLDQQFMVYMQGLKRTAGVKSLDELPAGQIPGAAELKQNTARVLELLREIKTVDDENTAFAHKKMADIKGKMVKSNNFKKVSAAYFGAGHGMVNSYFDKKK